MATPNNTDRLCIKHRLLYESIWKQALRGGLSSPDAREYASLEIVERAAKGEISGEIDGIADESSPIEVGVLSPADGGVMGPIAPLTPNPPTAPRKVIRLSPLPNKPRTIGNLVPNFQQVLQLPESSSSGSTTIIPSEDRAAVETKAVKPEEPPPKYPFARKKPPYTWGQGHGYYDDDHWERWQRAYGD
jgi:hypothetical protein